jgi:hypothetical protein
MATHAHGGVNYRRGAFSFLIAVLLLFGSHLRGAAVDVATAARFARNWLAASENSFGVDGANYQVDTCTAVLAEDGTTLAYHVSLTPQGFLIISADDRLQPLVMVSPAGSYDDQVGNPLRRLLHLDMTQRLAAAAEQAPEIGKTRGAPVEPPSFVAENKAAWAARTGPHTRAGVQAVVTESWVDSFVKSTWDQSTKGSGEHDKVAIYNYYTPLIAWDSYSFDPGNPNNVVSGCVATAMAQILRYYEWPQEPIGSKTGSGTVQYDDPVLENATESLSGTRLRGGNGNGGKYDWSIMDLRPTGAEDFSHHRMIGALLFDVGLTVEMNYSNEGSGAFVGPSDYTGNFDYASARSIGGFDQSRASLDARRPIQMSISPAVGKSGHSIICDGYGRIDGRWFWHFNMGWGGSADGWYSVEEHWPASGFLWNSSGVGGVGNIYRRDQQQPNELYDGLIISGRVTDSLGNPVPGVCVRLHQKTGEADGIWTYDDEPYLHMLAWYDPINPAIKVSDATFSADPRADYRNYTDENGIWAMDRVPAGDYVVVLEKKDDAGGYSFAGNNQVRVAGANLWGLNFVASALEALGLQSWWQEGNWVFLEFNRPLGELTVDLSKIRFGDGVDAIQPSDAAALYMSQDSNIMLLDLSYLDPLDLDGKLLYLEAGCFQHDPDGASGQAGHADAPIVELGAQEPLAKSDGAPADYAPSLITGISRCDADGSAATVEDISASMIHFKVGGSDLTELSVMDFVLRVDATGKRHTPAPQANIVGWDAATGLLTVNVGPGDGYIRANVIPTAGRPYLQGESWHVDNAGPIIVEATLSSDNKYVDITWNEPVGGKNEPLQSHNLLVSLQSNGGSVTSVVIDDLTDLDGNALQMQSQRIRVWLKYTPELSAKNTTMGQVLNPKAETNPSSADLKPFTVPSGCEEIAIMPVADSVFDELLNAATVSTTTGDLRLYDNNPPRVINAVLSYDNYSLKLVFNKRVYSGNGNSGGGAYYYTDAASGNERNLLPRNFEISVLAEDGTGPATLEINQAMISHPLGSSYCFLDLGRSAVNRKAIDPSVDPARSALRVVVTGVCDFYANKIVETDFNIALWQPYRPGYAGLPPPMFTNRAGAYTRIESDPTVIVYEKENVGFGQLAGAYEENGVTNASSVISTAGNSAEGLQYYGIWYRDLDGDGRIDAIDLNFHNPYYTTAEGGPSLVVGSSALANFSVWVQNNDPEDLDYAGSNYFPPEQEGPNWETGYPLWEDYPAYNDNSNSIRNFASNYVGYNNFSLNWTKVTVTGAAVLDNNQNVRPRGGGDGNAYSVLRLTLNQDQIAPRTWGDRFVMLTYSAPIAWPQEGQTYNKTVGPRISADKHPEATSTDEEAGIYWHWPAASAPNKSGNADTQRRHIDWYYIVDGFGPVVAWDGAAAVPVAATAWRSTPYPKLEETNFGSYDYLDVVFSEPLAYVADSGMANVGDRSDTDRQFGAWGAEILDFNTDRRNVRFHFNGSRQTNRSFTFNGSLFDLGPGFSLLTGPGVEATKTTQFSGTAVGVQIVDSRYRVVGFANDNAWVELLQVDATNASLTSYGRSDHGTPTSTTSDLSVHNVTLNTLAQGGNYRYDAASWRENREAGGTATFDATGNVVRSTSAARDRLSYAVALRNNFATPGASFYGMISALTVRNDNMGNFARANDSGSHYSIPRIHSLQAPSPIERGWATATTPERGVLSGPVYAMVKASASIPTNNTSRIGIGQETTVLGIDVAARASHRLEAVTLRFVDCSYGQFDPAIDFEPLADDSSSGVRLYYGNQILMTAMDGNEWSQWRRNAEGLFYRQVRLRLTQPLSVPLTGGEAFSHDLTVRVVPSDSFNLGDCFYAEIPSDGFFFNSGGTVYSAVRDVPDSWGTASGTQGSPFIDHYYKRINNNGRWDRYEAITSREAQIVVGDIRHFLPLYDGGRPYFASGQDTPLLTRNGQFITGLYYAKKNNAVNPESYPLTGVGGASEQHMGRSVYIGGNGLDIDYNVDYAPGDDIWYDIGGTPGVYDAGIDIPLFGNADGFPLPWSVEECGARSAQYRAAAPARVGDVATATIAAPSEATAMLGIDIHDAGRGFGPRFPFGKQGGVFVETISKNILGGTYENAITYDLASKTLRWNGGSPKVVAADGRYILEGAGGADFIVVKVDWSELSAASTNLQASLVVSDDSDRDIQQPTAMSGLRIHAAGTDNLPGASYLLQRRVKDGQDELSWRSGDWVDVSAPGLYTLNPSGKNYLHVEVNKLGGASSENLAVYSTDGLNITPFLNIEGLEIMAVSDMVNQGFYRFTYDGAGSLKWHQGALVNVRDMGMGDYKIVLGDLEGSCYVVVRRGAGNLANAAVEDRLFINQSYLLRVVVDITDLGGVAMDHFNALSATDPSSGVALYWDADANGVFGAGDVFVPLANTPKLVGSGNRYTCELIPDLSDISAWLSSPQNASSQGYNFFVCVRTTVDMSFGDAFSVRATVYDPTEPDTNGRGEPSFATGTSKRVSCSTITNTVFSRLTRPNQQVDPGTSSKPNTVGLIAIDHYLGTPDVDKPVYISELRFALHDVSGFNPKKALADMNASSAAERGIVLFSDFGNENGRLDPGVDAVIPSTILNVLCVSGDPSGVKDAGGAKLERYLNPRDGDGNPIPEAHHAHVLPDGSYVLHDSADNELWVYRLMPEETSDYTKVPNEYLEGSSAQPDHFIAVNFSKGLNYGTKLYGSIQVTGVTYSTGPGNAASALTTHTLSGTVATDYQDISSVRQVSLTAGLIVNACGANVTGYQKLNLSYNPATGLYYLNWGDYSVEVSMREVATYTLGDPDSADYIRVTFDPIAFLREDTIFDGDGSASSGSGRPPADLKLGTALTPLDESIDNLAFIDSNSDGRYTPGETVVLINDDTSRTIILGGAGDALLDTAALSPFIRADQLSFWDRNGNDKYDDGEPIVHDSDYVYSLPWMDYLIDSDNHGTPGMGAAANLDVGSSLDDAADASPEFGENAPSGLYLYFIDMDGNGAFTRGTDYIISRRHSSNGAIPAAVFDSSIDRVVLDNGFYDELSEEEQARFDNNVGELLEKLGIDDTTPLLRFASGDYLRFRRAGTVGQFEQGEALVLSYDDEYQLPNFSWVFRADSSPSIPRYNPNAPAPFNEPEFNMAAIVGLDLSNSGAQDVRLESLQVRFISNREFTTADLRDLSDDENSGVLLYRDSDGNGVFNPLVDQLVPLAAKPFWTPNGSEYVLTFSPSGLNQVQGESVDGIYDFFVVVQAGVNANNTLAVNDGDSFHVEIRTGDLVLNKTINEISVSSNVVSIDSKAPQLESAVLMDSDKNGYIERLILEFDEALQYDRVANGDIWKITDYDSGTPYKVLSAAMEEGTDNRIVLELQAEDSAATTSKASLALDYTASGRTLTIDCPALVDYAGNAVNFKADQAIRTGDTVSPLLLHNGISLGNAGYEEELQVNTLLAFYYRDRNGNDQWDEGEDIWYAYYRDEIPGSLYAYAAQRVWNGGDAWTTPIGYADGKALAVGFCDRNGDGRWQPGEFLWIERNEKTPLDGPEYSDVFSYLDEPIGDLPADIAVPLLRTEEIGVVDSDGNGKVDALRVLFSENLQDNSMAGYVNSLDKFISNRWVLGGYSTLYVWRQGITGTPLTDNQNNNLLYFGFEESAEPDTALVPAWLQLLSGESLTDRAGNVLNGAAGYSAGTLLLTDQAMPVLLSAVNASPVRIDETGNLAAGAQVLLSFSEPLLQYREVSDLADLVDFEIDQGDGTFVSLASVFGANGVEWEHDGATLLLSITADSTGWAERGAQLRVCELADSCFGDAVGHNLLPLTLSLEGIEQADLPRIEEPATGSFIRGATDDLAVKIHLGDLVVAESWSLELFRGHGSNRQSLQRISSGDAALAELSDDVADFTGWRSVGSYAYTLVLSMDGVQQDESEFFSAADDDVLQAAAGYVRDGLDTDVDIDEVISIDNELAANWLDFCAEYGLPTASKYKIRWEVDGVTVFPDSDFVFAQSFARPGSTLITGTSYVAVVSAYNADGVLMAEARSNGVEAVNALKDIWPPKAISVNDGLSGPDIDYSPSLDSLSANWEFEDDYVGALASSGIVGYKYRILAGPEASEWTEDNSTSSQQRRAFAATVVDGRAWAIAGFNGSTTLKTVEEFNPLTRQWTTLPRTLQTARSNFAFAELADADLIVAGGLGASGALESIERYTAATGWQTLGSLTTARYGATAVKVAEDIVWVIGGANDMDELLTSIEIIDLSAATPTVQQYEGILNGGRSDFRVLRQQRGDNSFVLVIGGADDTYAASKVIDVLKVQNNGLNCTPASAKQLQEARYGFAAIVVPTTQAVLVVGGHDGTNMLSSVERIDAQGDVDFADPMQEARMNFPALWLESVNSVLVAGGNSQSTELASVENDGSLTWRHGKKLSLVRMGHALALVGSDENQRVVSFGGTVGTKYSKLSESRPLVDVLVDWQEQAEDFVTREGLGLTPGGRYYFEVMAQDGAGNWSLPEASDGVLVGMEELRAQILCDEIPDGGTTPRRDYVIMIGGGGVDSYRYSFDGTTWLPAGDEWLSVSEPVPGTAGMNLGPQQLHAIGRNAAGMEQPLSDKSSVSWTIVQPVAEIASGLPAGGTGSYASDYSVVIAGAGLDSYKYRLQSGADWGEESEALPIAQAIALTGLVPGDYVLAVRGGVDGVWQGDGVDATTRSWTVEEAEISLSFDPALPSFGVMPCDSFTVQVHGKQAGELDVYRYQLQDAAGNVLLDKGAEPIAISELFTLSDLTAGSYTLVVEGRVAELGSWLPVSQPFTVAYASFDEASIPAAAITASSHSLGVKLNGLERYKYQLNDDPVQGPSDADTIELTGLGFGIHSVKLWGYDAVNDILQVVPAVATLQVVAALPTGRLTAELSSNVDNVYITDAAVDVDYSLVFSDEPMAAPLAKHFDILPAGAASVVAIVVDPLNPAEFLVTLRLQPLPAGTGSEQLSLRLQGASVYGINTGSSNLASNEWVTLLFSEPVLAMSLSTETLTEALEPSGAPLPAAGVRYGDFFALKIMAKSNDFFMGGDVSLTYDTAKFEAVDPEAMSADPDLGHGALQSPYNSAKMTTCSIDPATEAITLGGLWNLEDEAQADAEGRIHFATLIFKVVGLGDGADTDFQLSAGDDGLLLQGIGILSPSHSAVSFGTAAVQVDSTQVQLSLSLADAAINEGEETSLTLSLSQAVYGDTDVTISNVAGLHSILAGDSSIVIPLQHDHDAVLSGDRVVNYAITTAATTDPSVILGYDADGVDLTIYDIDYSLTISLSKMDDTELTDNAIDEGEQFKVTASLPAGVTVACGEGALIQLGFAGSAILGEDYTISGQLLIADGQNQGSIMVTSYRDFAYSPAKTISLQVLGISLGTQSLAAFTAPADSELSINNIDQVPGDLSGGDGIVNFMDLMLLLSYYEMPVGVGPGFAPAEADLNGDGIIDFSDLLILLSYYEAPEAQGGGTRSATRAGEKITLRMEADKSRVAIGGTVSVTVYASTNASYGIAGITTDVDYTADCLSFAGDFNPDVIIKDFSFVRQGSLDDANGKISGLAGATLVPATGAAGTEAVFAEFSLKITDYGDGTAIIDLSNAAASCLGGGLSTEAGNLLLEMPDPLAITILDQTPFHFALLSEYRSGTRALENAELVLGMQPGASFEYSEADGDRLNLPNFDEVYSLYFSEPSRSSHPELKYDIRDLSDGETWHIKGTVPAGGVLVLDWSLNGEGVDADYSMPDYYDFWLDLGDGTSINMRSVNDKYLSFRPGEIDLAVRVIKQVEAEPDPTMVSFGYLLPGGWNLIGVPIVLDEESSAKLVALEAQGYDGITGDFAEISDFVAGQAYWVFVAEDKLLEQADGSYKYAFTLTGTQATAKSVPVKQGWNLITPLFSSNLVSYGNPVGLTIPNVWHWTSDGYRWLLDSDSAIVGKGYYVYCSTEEVSIWPVGEATGNTRRARQLRGEAPQAIFPSEFNSGDNLGIENPATIMLRTNGLVPESFKFMLESSFVSAKTRAVASAELILGMKTGASLDYVPADGDSLSLPHDNPGVYDLYFHAPERNVPKLKWDIRPLNPEGDVWQVKGSVPAGGSLTLDWSLSAAGTDADYSMPEAFDFWLDLGDGPNINMRTAAAKAKMWTEGAIDFKIQLTRHAAEEPELLSLRYELTPGWNLIGVPLKLDDDSIAKLDALPIYTLNDAGTMASAVAGSYRPGVGYWLFVGEEQLDAQGKFGFTLTGSEADAEAVQVNEGWNLVSPLYSNNRLAYANPMDENIPTVWYWSAGGYRWLLPEGSALVGKGYWFHSDQAKLIWPVK